MATETPHLTGFPGPEKAGDADYFRCIHCGLCLNHCPTYRLWGREADSPRGRIRQMILVDQGEMPLDATFVTHIDRCLDCRACETACPSGVEYGKLVELARGQILQNYRRPFLSDALRSLFYRQLLPYPGRLAALARVLRFTRNSGLERLAASAGLLRLLGVADRAQLAPPIDREFFFSRLGRTYPAQGPRRARVAFFAGCIAQLTFSSLNDATIRVLQANGCEVVVPAGQWCCGALAVHAGFRDVARDLARRNFHPFLAGKFDAIITNAAGCGSTLKEYELLFPPEHPDRSRALDLQHRVRDAAEFLDQLGLSAPLQPIPLRVTYQDSCHLLHGQKIREAPRRLIRSIPGIELVEMELADQCCGSAGVYNVTQTEASLALLQLKMEKARATGAQTIITANPGCILQLRAGARRHSTGQQVLHVVELLDRSLGGRGKSE